MGMNKFKAGIFAVSVAAASLVSVAPAQAEADVVAIIDAHFEPSLISGNVVSVCVVSQFSCNSSTPLRTRAHYQAYNHGTIMADIVRQTNPSAKLVLIKAAAINAPVNGNNLNLALDWLIANGVSQGIDSVSLSYNSGNGSTCRPVTPGSNPNTVHDQIVGKIATLKSMKINFYAASGNYGSGNNIDYPACIQDVVAVGSTLFRGSMQLSDIVVSGFTFTSNSLRSNLTSLQDSDRIGLDGVQALRVGHTTSVATAIAAANN